MRGSKRRRTIGGALAIGSMLVTALPALAGAGSAAPASPSSSAAPDSLRVHVLSDIGAVDLDPTDANTFASRSLLSGLVIRSLTQLVYDSTSRQMVLKPDLALGLGSHNATYTRWTFTLRRDVKFENGQLVRPIDVKYGIERSFDRATFPDGPGFSNAYFLDGHTYKGPYRSGTDYDGVVISGQHITLKMSRPFPDLPYYLAFPAMSPIPSGQASDPATYKNHPLATGPYKFSAYTPGHKLILVRNPYWDPATDPGRTAHVNEYAVRLDMPRDEIDQTILQDTGTARTSISLDTVLASDYQAFRSQASKRLVQGSNRCVDMFDPDNRQVTNIQVRRALGWAYPYKAAWAAGGSIRGVTRLPATNLETIGTPGRISYNPLPGHTPGTTDAATAKAILRAAGRLHTVVKFAYETDVPGSVQVKNVLVSALQAAGFDPEPYATTKRNYVRNVLDNPKAPVNVRAVTRCSPFPTGGSVLVPQFHSTDLAVHGFGSNYSAFSNRHVDNLMTSDTLLPLARQPAAWNALDTRIENEYYPVVVTAYHGVALMRGDEVHGASINDTLGMPNWSAITLHS